jgi:RNA polymerase sigma factor (sigma-70 family)
MQNQHDAELLQDYARTGSEPAFGEIVKRYADVVYSAALRQVGEAEQARDVAQMVFTDLARKAGNLPANTVLVGWLHRGARLAALEQLRKDQRRETRERHAMDWHDSNPSDDWTDVRPVLDEAIATLGHEDRDALLLRFFKNESLAGVGATLGVSEDAAQKRVSRALDKLREFLAGRGIKTTAAALSAALIANAVQSAPAGIAGSLAASALTNSAAASTAVASSWFALSPMKSTLLIIGLAGGIGALAILHLNAQRRLHEAKALNEQLTTDLATLRAADQRLADQSNELARVRQDASDVLRLRGDVARLRRDLADARTLAASNPSTNSPPQAPESQVNVKARVYAVPLNNSLAEGMELLTDPQTRQLFHSLERTKGVKTINESQVTTLSGRQAQLQIRSDDPPSSGPLFALDVLPIHEANSPRIDLRYRVYSEAMVARSGDLPPGNSSPTVRETRSVEVTNATILWDGQTVVMTRLISDNEKWLTGDDPDDQEPRKLLIFLTPTLIDPAGNRISASDESSQAQLSDPDP